MARHISKNIKKSLEQFDQSKEYLLIEAIDIIKKVSYVKFDASIDLSFNLNLDTRKVEQQLRGSILLPNGTGKKIRVLVASDNPKNQEASKKMGADIVASGVELEEILKKGIFDFDVMVAEPKMMITLGKYGKVLGPKGLMPNPKTGTVTSEPAKAVEELKKGKANYRADKGGIVHSLIGKVSMDTKDLVENSQTLISLIKKLKPSTIKGIYLISLNISSTMGPSIKVKID